jgi:hypothetical protein
MCVISVCLSRFFADPISQATTEDYEMVLAHTNYGLPALLRELAQVRVHLEAVALMNPDAPVIPQQHVFIMVLCVIFVASSLL